MYIYIQLPISWNTVGVLPQKHTFRKFTAYYTWVRFIVLHLLPGIYIFRNI